jgi:hypothetical protein
VPIVGADRIRAAALPRPTPTEVLRPRGRRTAVVGGAILVAVLGAGVAVLTQRANRTEPASAALPSAAAPAAPSTTPPPAVVEEPKDSAPAPAPRLAPAPAEPPRPAARRKPVEAPPGSVPAAPAKVGYLTINAVPYGTVSIDGVVVGDTPVVRHEVPPGEHRIQISREGFRTDSTLATVTAGNEVRLSRALVQESR